MKLNEFLCLVKRAVLVLVLAYVGLWAEYRIGLTDEDEQKLRLIDETGKLETTKDYYKRYGANVGFVACMIDFQEHSCVYVMLYIEKYYEKEKKSTFKASVPENNNLKNNQSAEVK